MIRNNTLPRSEMLADKFDRAPDAARVVASATSMAKAESFPQLASWTDMIKENHEKTKFPQGRGAGRTGPQHHPQETDDA